MANVGSFSVEAGDMLIQYGCAPKTAVESRVVFDRAFAGGPFRGPLGLVVSPFWEGQESEVGHAETIGRIDPEGFSTFSDNAASNYFVSWIAAGPNPDLQTPQFVDRVEVGEMRLQFDRAPKPAPPVAISPLFRLGFPEPPNVQVSPIRLGQARGVGHAETVNAAEIDSFEVSSDNLASNYEVSWMATGLLESAGPRPESPLGYREFVFGDVILRAGRWNKTGAMLRLALGLDDEPGRTPFAEPPTVVVTPFWEGAGRGVSHAETLNLVDTFYFETVSGNAGPNYFVSWMAIGRRV